MFLLHSFIYELNFHDCFAFSLFPQAWSLLSMQDLDKDCYIGAVVQIENLNGKEYVFQIQLNDYNLKYGWKFYTVKKVFESFKETDKKIQLDKMTEVRIL